MTRFRTEIQISKPSIPIGYDSRLMFMGSCFAESVGEKFKEARLSCNINPFGILYNPVSIAQSIETLMNQELYSESDLISHEGLWHSLDHHGKFSSPDKDLALAQINKTIKESSQYLKKCQFLFITFGTSFVYEYMKTGTVVANCHKLPASYFNHYRLEVDEIVELYKNLIVKILVLNPSIRIVFTVSPVRHWKDGAHGNQVNKAVLLLAIDQLVNLFNQAEYFPAYELLLDDLRDYRFYADDLLHPNNVAVEYIWEKMVQSWFDDRARQFCSDTAQLVKALNHRPLYPNTNEYNRFLESMVEKVNSLIDKYPQADFIEDRNTFMERLVMLNDF